MSKLKFFRSGVEVVRRARLAGGKVGEFVSDGSVFAERGPELVRKHGGNPNLLVE
jgi:hypothetical protein